MLAAVILLINVVLQPVSNYRCRPYKAGHVGIFCGFRFVICHICLCICICTCACTCTCTRTLTRTRSRSRTHSRTCMHAFMYACMHVSMYVCMYEYIYMYIYIYIYIYDNVFRPEPNYFASLGYIGPLRSLFASSLTI